MAVLESARFRSEGDTKTLTLMIDEGEDLKGPFQAELALHDDVAVTWCASSPATSKLDAG